MHLAASLHCCCLGFLVPLYYISFEFGRKGRMSHGAPSRSLKLDCQVQVDVTLRPLLGIFTMGILSLRLITIAQVSAVLLAALVTLGGAQRYKVMS